MLLVLAGVVSLCKSLWCTAVLKTGGTGHLKTPRQHMQKNTTLPRASDSTQYPLEPTSYAVIRLLSPTFEPNTDFHIVGRIHW